jgi:hypothetical protein
MTLCRICGEEKIEKEFYKLKGFYKWIKSPRKWCRSCMKMYVEMRKEKERKEMLEGKEWQFSVSFA